MKIYHLNIKDTEDQEFDMHLHFGHDTKTATDLWEDYTNAYSDVIDNLNNILDVPVIKIIDYI